MKSFHNFGIFCTIGLGLIKFADALHCFQCGDSSKDGTCLTNTAGMEAEHKRWNNTGGAVVSDGGGQQPYEYIKDCSTEYSACVIERIEEIVYLSCEIPFCFSYMSDERCICIDSPKISDYWIVNKNIVTPRSLCITEPTGHLHAYIRDCSNRMNFSITDPNFNSQLLDASLNHTRCVYKPLSKLLVCVTLCNSDFCNGPQIESRGSYTSPEHILVDLIIISAVWAVLSGNKKE